MNARNKISSLQRHIGPAICMLLLFAASPARAMSDPARPCPRCLGDICFAESAPPAVPLWERYGRGFVENPDGDPVHCYRDAGGNYWALEEYHLNHGITDLFVSRKPTCQRHARPAAPLPAPRTPEGLTLGDSYARMIQLYGPPEWEHSPPLNDFSWMAEKDIDDSRRYGDKLVIYSTSAESPDLWVHIYLRKDRVSAIRFSRTPYPNDSR